MDKASVIADAEKYKLKKEDEIKNLEDEIRTRKRKRHDLERQEEQLEKQLLTMKDEHKQLTTLLEAVNINVDKLKQKLDNVSSVRPTLFMCSHCYKQFQTSFQVTGDDELSTFTSYLSQKDAKLNNVTDFLFLSSDTCLQHLKKHHSELNDVDAVLQVRPPRFFQCPANAHWKLFQTLVDSVKSRIISVPDITFIK